VGKRSIDIILSILLLVAATPLLILAAVLILLDSSGPILFRQRRMGRGFQGFELYKLRTMAVAGTGTAITLGPDPRVTRIGRLLRRLKIDELPQLWNVLRGEMSLVGPRPVIPELAWEFADAYAGLLSVRPGLTDPATLRYANEVEILSAVSDPLTYFKTVVMRHKLRLSATYLKKATLASDLQCILLTGLAILAPPVRRRLSQPLSGSVYSQQHLRFSAVRRPLSSAGRFGGSMAARYPGRGSLSALTGVRWAGRSRPAGGWPLGSGRPSLSGWLTGPAPDRCWEDSFHRSAGL